MAAASGRSIGRPPRRSLWRALATGGFRVRISGQDAERGTFSQRHAVLHDVENGQLYMPLAQSDSGASPVEIYNSPLSEAGVLGFDYGYSLDCPDGLVVWEAQFGDFANAAQVIIDQFIVSAEEKWNRLCGIVLLAAARLRRAGARAFQRPARTISQPGGEGQYPGL